MRNAKIVALPMVLILGLLISGLAYAHWSDILWIEGSVATGDAEWEFLYNSISQKDPPGTNDWTCDYGLINLRQLDKDIGSTTCEFVDTDGDGDWDTLAVSLDTVYPCYYEHIAFYVQNIGTVPLVIQKVVLDGQEYTAPFYATLDLDGDGYDDIEIYYGNNFGQQMDPYPTIPYKVDISFDIHVLQDAPEGTTLSFTIEIIAVNWNEP